MYEIGVIFFQSDGFELNSTEQNSTVAINLAQPNLYAITEPPFT